MANCPDLRKRELYNFQWMSASLIHFSTILFPIFAVKLYLFNHIRSLSMIHFVNSIQLSNYHKLRNVASLAFWKPTVLFVPPSNHTTPILFLFTISGGKAALVCHITSMLLYFCFNCFDAETGLKLEKHKLYNPSLIKFGFYPIWIEGTTLLFNQKMRFDFLCNSLKVGFPNFTTILSALLRTWEHISM